MEIRRAVAADGPAFVGLVRALADMEKLEPPTAEAQKRLLEHAFADRPPFELWVADDGDEIVAYAVTFITYSTFRALPSLYLEDLFVTPTARRQGIATAILKRLRQEAADRGCGRIEWVVLDWNRGACELYRRVGAEIFPDFRLCRIDL
ncbi:MAG: GNAT family N-acetyltransferase [Deltaproteobacteria bacterium]|jgi:GNAT superfamily N-acetyltransferase|nr:GNAT family N-acetyltransferase [Deltaproteobacteria bacterium]